MALTPTRERLVTEAVRLFSAQGYEATRVSQIEAAAGLAAGSGALYHHFTSKEALLEAGIARQLDRRHAMGDIRALFAGLGNLRAELTVLGRYLDAVLAAETELIQIAARTPTGRSTRLDAAYSALVTGLKTELADWISTWAPTAPGDQCELLATVGLNSILAAHFSENLFNQPSTPATADYLTEWTALLAARIQTLDTRHSDPSLSDPPV